MESEMGDAQRRVEADEAEEDMTLGAIIKRTRNPKKQRTAKGNAESVPNLNAANQSSQPTISSTDAPEDESSRDVEINPIHGNASRRSVEPIEPTVPQNKGLGSTDAPVHGAKNLKKVELGNKNPRSSKKSMRNSKVSKRVREEASYEPNEEGEEDEDIDDDGEEEEEEEVTVPAKKKKNSRYDPLPTKMSDDPKIRKRQCTTCFRICSAPDKLRRHALTHTNVAQSICPNCNKTIKFQYNLKTHLTTCTQTTWEEDLEILWKLYPDWMRDMYRARKNPALPLPPLPPMCTLQKNGVVTGYDPRALEIQAQVARAKSERQSLGKKKLKYDASIRPRRNRKRVSDDESDGEEALDMGGRPDEVNKDDSDSDRDDNDHNEEPIAV